MSSAVGLLARGHDEQRAAETACEHRSATRETVRLDVIVWIERRVEIKIHKGPGYHACQLGREPYGTDAPPNRLR